MNNRDWDMSIALGFISIPLDFLIRCVPTPPVERLFIALYIMHDPEAPPKLTKSEKKAEEERKREEEKEVWNPAINEVHTDYRRSQTSAVRACVLLRLYARAIHNAEVLLAMTLVSSLRSWLWSLHLLYLLFELVGCQPGNQTAVG